ncbi:MAG TPA: hypothetical protein VFG44_06305 [Burkholderiales bacterium]|nr:hypothetical protein [Burkholderiales bacterium]
MSEGLKMRTVLRLIGATLVGTVALTPTPLRGQSPAVPNQQTAPGWIFTPSIAVGGTWDDNVLLVNPGPDPSSDYASPITPGVSLDYTGKLTRFSSGYSGSIIRYASLGDLNSFQQSLRAMIEHRATARLTFFGQEVFSAAPTTDVLQLSGVPFYRIGARSNAAGGGVQAALAKHTTLRSMYTLRSVAFDLNTFTANQLQGGRAHDITANLDHALSAHLTLGGEYAFSHAVVNSSRFNGIEGPQDRFNIQTGSLTAQYQVAAGTMLAGGFGVARLGAGLTHEARTGPEWRASITQRAGRGSVAASYRRAYIPSFGFGGTFQNQQWSGNVHMPIGRTRAYVDGGIYWLNNEPLDTDQPRLRTAWFTSNVGSYATRWLRLEGFYGRTQQDTRRAGGQLERNQLGFRIIAAKPLKLR